MAIRRPQPKLNSFHGQLEEACRLYPELKIVRTYQGNYLEGMVAIKDEVGVVFDQFQIEIHNSVNFPHSFPILYEVGGRIPHSQEWHVYISELGPKKSCCITVPPIEAIACKNGISVSRFIKTEVLPYLYKQAYRLKYGYYPGKEFDHGLNGLWEYYGELFNCTNRDEILEYLSFYAKKLHKKSRCFCGSDRKFKECHTDTYKALRTIPDDLVKDHIIKLTASHKKS